VWGTCSRNLPGHRQLRFIPTCVGNILGDLSAVVSSPVHPHVCGEHAVINDTLLNIGGSSPRVWGTCRI